MMLTKAQAAETWCPMVRIARVEIVLPATLERDDLTNVVAGCNRDALGSPTGFVLKSCRCIADGCAMWRWVDKAPNEKAAARLGYCGLAGKPA